MKIVTLAHTVYLESEISLFSGKDLLSPVLYGCSVLGVQTIVSITCTQRDTLFSGISNAIGNFPLARGNTSNEIALGYEIITPNRLKLGGNNYRSLERSGIELEMSSNFTKILDRNRSVYQQWYQGFIKIFIS